MQYELGFGDNTGPEPVSAAAPGTVSGIPGAPDRRGVLSGRPWRAAGVPTPEVLEAVARALPLSRRVSGHLVALLAVRGVVGEEALERFFYPEIEHLHDPLLLDEIEPAARRLLSAASRGEKVAVHGDFDVDGLTGTALLAELLRALNVEGRRCELLPPFVPDRARDGYGVARRMLDAWALAGVGLLVTVDTGSAAHEEIAVAVAGGMDVVVLDHHLFDARPAGVHALVNPRRPGNRYPNAELCGVAVAFKLAQALAQLEPGCLPPDFLASVQDLAALGLIADQMPLVDENRVLVRRGLERISDRRTVRPGLRALLEKAGLDHGQAVTATHVAYQLAPRLNACGRIGRVQTALDLLLTRDADEARDLAAEADETNKRRRDTDQRVMDEAVIKALPFAERGDPGLILGDERWHRGVIGISAARLVERFNVPSILFSLEGEESRGSARSVPDVDIKAVLDRCAGLLVRYGGHAQAAGMTLRTRDLDAFREAFLVALRQEPEHDGVPEAYDLDLALDAMTVQEVALLNQECALLEPFGEGNRAPVFRCDGLRLSAAPATVGRGGEHLRFRFAGPGQPRAAGTPALALPFISFGSNRAWEALLGTLPGGKASLQGRRWDILFQVATNNWRPANGAAVEPVQMQLLDIRPGDEP